MRGVLLVVLAGLVSSATAAESTIYRAYSGPERPEKEVASLGLGDADWVRIDSGPRLEKKTHEVIKLLPGEYQIEWCEKFAVSAMIDLSMSAAYVAREDVVLEAGHGYVLGADRTTGSGYRTFMWIEDEGTHEIIAGFKKPKRLLPQQVNSRPYQPPQRLEDLYGRVGKKNLYSKDKDVQAFFEAALSGNRSDAEALLSAGVDLNATDRDGATALIRAAVDDRPEAVDLLVDLGAEVNARAAGKDGRTALMVAASLGHTEVVRILLLSPEIDINAQSKGLTALILADYNDQPEIRQLLVAHPDCDESSAAVTARKDELLEDLAEDVQQAGLPRATHNRLVGQLKIAYQSNLQEVYCPALRKFVESVEARKGKKIPLENADKWISEAETIAHLSCPG